MDHEGRRKGNMNRRCIKAKRCVPMLAQSLMHTQRSTINTTATGLLHFPGWILCHATLLGIRMNAHTWMDVSKEQESYAVHIAWSYSIL